jgi:peroxiredoxin
MNKRGQAPRAAAPLAPGTRAPDVTLRTTPDQTVSLREFRGQPVILAFYPADWSPVWGDQSWRRTCTRRGCARMS